MRVLWIVLLLGCGRFSFDPVTGGDDTQAGDARGDGTGGSGDGGGSAGVDALMSPGCGTTPILVDDFSDGAIDSRWTMVTSAGYGIAESGGNVAVTFPATAPANTRAGYRQAATVAFTNTCAIVEIASVPMATNAFAYVRLGTPTLNVEFFIESNTLSGRFTNGGTSGTVGGGVAFDPVNHRFLRIRNTGGNNYNFDAGPSLTSFPTLIGSMGGMIVMPSPNSLEIGGSTTTAMSSGAGTAAFASVTFLGP